MKESESNLVFFFQVIAFISLILINFYKCALRASSEWLFAIAHSRRVESCSAGASMPTSGAV